MPNSISISPKRIALIIAIIGGVWAFLVSFHNAQYARESGNRRYLNGMIKTADDASYLRPPENFLRDGIWKDNSQGVSSYIQRPPGMGLIHLVFYSVSPNNYAILHRIFNLLLHVLAIYVFGLTALQLLGRKGSMIAQFMYTLLPCFWGYLFYYITESITPSILVFLFFGYVKHHYWPSAKWLIYQSICAGILLSIRPQLGIFLLPFLYYLFIYLKEKQNRRVLVFLLCCFFAFGGFGLWQIRSIAIAKKYTGLHGIYDATNNTQYRPIHRSFGELFKIWECNGEYFHTIFSEVWHSALEREYSENKEVIQAERNIRLNGCKGIYETDIQGLLDDYGNVISEERSFLIKNQPMAGETESEIKLRLHVESLTKELKKKNLLLCYIITPLRSAKFMFTKSQLNMGIFQHKYRGYWWMEVLRFVCLSLIVLSTIFTLSNVFRRKNIPIFLFALSAAGYLFYLFFVQKINEERYLMPLLPILLLIGAFTIFQGKKYFAKPKG